MDTLKSAYEAKLRNLGKVRIVGSYVNSYTPTKHKCQSGHTFSQQPAKILLELKSGINPCRTCVDRREVANTEQRMTLAEYNKRLRKYGITAKTYVNAYTEVEHVCSQQHVFTSKPSILSLTGNCPHCLTATQRAKIDNLIPVYASMHIELSRFYRANQQSIRAHHSCKLCVNEWEAKLSTRPKVCSNCGSRHTKTGTPIDVKRTYIPRVANANVTAKHKAFLLALKEKHGGRIHCLSNYELSTSPIQLSCQCGNIWTTTPTNVLNSVIGCPTCGIKHRNLNKTKTSEWYYAQCVAATDGTVTPIEKYVNDATPIKHKCLCGNVFTKRPGRILHEKKHGCSSCLKTNASGFSNTAINWLKQIELSTGFPIQHGANGSEHVIKLGAKKIRVDGFCEKTNTVYEFLGDAFHGSPYSYGPNDTPHPHNNKVTAKDLFVKDMARFTSLSKRGYNVVWVYESHFLLGQLITGQLFAGVNF